MIWLKPRGGKSDLSARSLISLFPLLPVEFARSKTNKKNPTEHQTSYKYIIRNIFSIKQKHPKASCKIFWFLFWLKPQITVKTCQTEIFLRRLTVGTCFSHLKRYQQNSSIDFSRVTESGGFFPRDAILVQCLFKKNHGEEFFVEELTVASKQHKVTTREICFLLREMDHWHLSLLVGYLSVFIFSYAASSRYLNLRVAPFIHVVPHEDILLLGLQTFNLFSVSFSRQVSMWPISDALPSHWIYSLWKVPPQRSTLLNSHLRASHSLSVCVFS